MIGPVPVADMCVAALGALGGRGEADAVHAWIAVKGPWGGDVPARRQVRTALGQLSAARPQLAVCRERRTAGRGRPGIWELTPAGEHRAAGREPCGLGWPPQGRSVTSGQDTVR